MPLWWIKCLDGRHSPDQTFLLTFFFPFRTHLSLLPCSCFLPLHFASISPPHTIGYETLVSSSKSISPPTLSYLLLSSSLSPCFVHFSPSPFLHSTSIPHNNTILADAHDLMVRFLPAPHSPSLACPTPHSPLLTHPFSR